MEKVRGRAEAGASLGLGPSASGLADLDLPNLSGGPSEECQGW